MIDNIQGTAPEKPKIHENPAMTSRDKKFEILLLETELLSCLNKLIADIPNIKVYDDSKLLRIFRWVYKRRKERWRHELKFGEAEEIMRKIISEFNKKRKSMSNTQRDEFREKTRTFLDLGLSRGVPYKENIPKIVITDKELAEILETNDVITAINIKSNLEYYELTLDLAITLTKLWIFNFGNNKLLYDIPNFKWLSDNDIAYLCDMSKQINKEKTFWHDCSSLRENIDIYFKKRN